MAGGFFSGGSSDAVNASVAEAEAAAREAEAARDEINNKFVEYAGQTEEGDYTVPNADDALITKFLRQDGTWNIPPAGGGGGAENLSELTDVDSNLSPTNDQILQYNSTTSQFEAVDPAAAGELSGSDTIDITADVVSVRDTSIGTTQLAADAVTNAKLADDAVQAANILDVNVTTAKLATDAVTTVKIAADAVTNAKLADDSVDSEQVVADAITTVKIVDDAVTTAKIVDDAVTGAKIVDEAIDEPKLNSTNTPTAGQVLSGNVDGTFTWVDQSGGGGTDNITASNGLVRTGNDIAVVSTGLTSTQIADDAISTAKIVTGAVTSNEIANATIVDGDIAATTITGGKLVNATITATQLASDSVTEVKIANNAVTNGKIINQAVNEDKLDVSNTGSTGQLLSSDGDGTFTWVTESGGTQYTAESGGGLALSAGNAFSIADDGVTAARLAANAVVSNSIVDGVVTGDKLAVTGTEVANAVIATDGSGNLQWASNSGTLAGLSDTNIPASITDRRFLEYSPSEDVWDAVSISDLLNISDLFDVVETNLQDNQFLRYETSSAKWINETVSIPAAVSVTAPLNRTGNVISIPNGSLTGTQIQNASIAGAKLEDNAITSAKIADLAVDTAELAANAVTTAKIADGAVTASKIPNNSLTAVQLATDSVSSFKLQDDSVITSKVADEAITEPKLAVTNAGTNGQVLSRAGTSFTWIDNGSGGESYSADGTTLNLSAGNQFSVADDGITATQLATDSVTADAIQNNAVTAAEIASGAVGTTEIAANAITDALIATGAIHGDKITNATISVNELGPQSVTTAKIFDAAVTNAKLADNAITNSKLGTDIPISTLSDVDTDGVNNGQILSYNGTTWVPINNSGGNTDNSRLAIALSPNSFDEGDADATVSVTLSIANALTGETISGQNVTATDPTGHAVTVTGSGNSWSFTGNGDNVGNYVVRASATFTVTGGATSVHSSSANLPVNSTSSDWYQWVTETEPTAITSADVVDNGTFMSPENAMFTRTTLAQNAYVALPTRATGYEFKAGILFATITDLGVVSTNYTLTRLDDFDQTVIGGPARVITITET